MSHKFSFEQFSNFNNWTKAPCAICGSNDVTKNKFSKNNITQDGKHYTFYHCPKCTYYAITIDVVLYHLRQDVLTGEQKLLLSCILREHSQNPLTITSDNIYDILASRHFPTDPMEAIDNIILYLAKDIKTQNQDKPIIPDDHYLDFYAKERSELTYWVTLSEELGYIEPTNNHKYRLKIEGWKRLGYIKDYSRQLSKTVFVAMSFHDDMDVNYTDGIAPALHELGYQPIQLKYERHNSQIDNKIVAEIKKSKFIVADFTLPDIENRNYKDDNGVDKIATRDGIYFECGFAQGLGVDVIRTCKKTQENELHFDINHYPVIFWEDINDLKKKLTHWIEATINK